MTSSTVIPNSEGSNSDEMKEGSRSSGMADQRRSTSSLPYLPLHWGQQRRFHGNLNPVLETSCLISSKCYGPDWPRHAYYKFTFLSVLFANLEQLLGQICSNSQLLERMCDRNNLIRKGSHARLCSRRDCLTLCRSLVSNNQASALLQLLNEASEFAFIYS